MPPDDPPNSPVPPPPARGDRASTARLVGVLLLGLLSVGAWWWVRGRASSASGPAAVFEYVRDRTLEGDGTALWHLMMAPARKDYEGFVENMRTETPPEYARDYRRQTGLRLEDLRKLKPAEILAREQLALAEKMYRGSRVFDEDVRGAGALIWVSLGDGSERIWYLRRDTGAWMIDNLRAVVDMEGRLLARPNTFIPPEWKEPRIGTEAKRR